MKDIVIGVALVVMVGGSAPAAQDPLSSAKDLYASAAYEEALSMLNSLGGTLAPEVSREASEYRAFCLYALGRTSEADAVVESIVRQDPLAPVSAIDVSPRIEQMFGQVRKRLLPTLIRDRLRAARTLVDQTNLADAEPRLVEARLMIAEAAKSGAEDESLSDLSVLVDGFLQLIQASRAQRAAAEAPAPSAPPGTPAVSNPPPVAPQVYTAADEGITPPVVIDQRQPLLVQEMKAIVKASQMRGVLSVLIDENGRVVDASVRPSLNPSFDAAVLEAVHQWKYVPAKKDGTPVRYLKMVALVP